MGLAIHRSTGGGAVGNGPVATRTRRFSGHLSADVVSAKDRRGNGDATNGVWDRATHKRHVSAENGS